MLLSIHSRGLAGARLDKCGGDLKKAFKWSSTKIKYWGSVGKPKKGQNQVEYYATYGLKMVKATAMLWLQPSV